MESVKVDKIEKKKQQILLCAIELAGEKGYHQTTMEEIAAKLQMTKGSMYYYFDNKQTLFFACQVYLMNECIQFADEIVRASHLTVEQKFAKLIEQHLLYILKVKGNFDLMAIEKELFTQEQNATLKNLRDDYTAYVDVIIIQYLTVHDLPVNEVTIRRNLLLNAMNGVIYWFSPNGLYNEQAIVHMVTKYLFAMIRSTDNEEVC